MPKWQTAPVSEGVGSKWASAPEGSVDQPSGWSAKDFGTGLARSAVDLVQGAANTLTLPVDLGINAVNAMTGKNYPTTAQTRGQFFRSLVPADQSGIGQAISAGTRGLGGAAAGLGIGSLLGAAQGPVTAAVGQQMVVQPMSQIAAGGAGGVSSDVARQMGAGPIGQTVAGLAGGALAGSLVGKLETAPQPAPSIENLRARSQAAYKAAEDSGIRVPQDALGTVAADIQETTRKLGYDPQLNPEIKASLDRLGRDTQGPMSLQDLEILRRVFKGAASSTNDHTSKIAETMIGKLDDFVNELPGPGMQDARRLWARSAKGEEIAQIMENASIRGQQNVSLSGADQALRVEFGKLARNPRRLRLFTDAEQEAIKAVATGGPISRALRLVGKLAPTSVVGGGTGVGLGYLLGGPIGAGVVPAIGAAAKMGGTMMTTRNANLLSELVRRGGALPPGAGVLAPTVLPALEGIYASRNSLPETP